MEQATKIQNATKQYLLKKRYYCTNDTDPYTLEKISDIEQLYIFKIVEGNSIHCFDIREMYKQYTTRNEKLFNPFTRRELEDHEINRFLVALTTLSNLGLKLDSEQGTIPEHVTDTTQGETEIHSGAVEHDTSVVVLPSADIEESIDSVNNPIVVAGHGPRFAAMVQTDANEDDRSNFIPENEGRPILIDSNTITTSPVTVTTSHVSAPEDVVEHKTSRSQARNIYSHKIISSILMYLSFIMIGLFLITRFSKVKNFKI